MAWCQQSQEWVDGLNHKKRSSGLFGVLILIIWWLDVSSARSGWMVWTTNKVKWFVWCCARASWILVSNALYISSDIWAYQVTFSHFHCSECLKTAKKLKIYWIGLVSSLCKYMEECLSLHQTPQLTAIQSICVISTLNVCLCKPKGLNNSAL